MTATRKYTDLLLSWFGIAIVIILCVAGGLALWAHNYVNDQVSSQLSAQKISFFPADAIYPCAAGVKSEDCYPQYASLKQYAGQELTTGAQAKAYADTQIGNDLKNIGGGQTYSELSAKAIADPTNATLQNEVAVVFKGTTLRGLLLNAYAFGQIATIAGWSAFFAFLGAGIMLILSILGFLHAYGKLGGGGARAPAEAS